MPSSPIPGHSELPPEVEELIRDPRVPLPGDPQEPGSYGTNPNESALRYWRMLDGRIIEAQRSTT